MTHRWLPALVAALLLGGVGAGIALSQSINGSGEVYIVAQQLEDGRVEFGLEQDGERILPSRRFFPADASEDRWLRSSPINIEAVAESSSSSEAGSKTISGSGDAYQSVGHFSAGTYVCTVSVVDNTSSYGTESHFSVTSYGSNERIGDLHANEIAASYEGTSRLSVGSGFSADVPEGEVFFEVKAEQGAQWTISCR